MTLYRASVPLFHRLTVTFNQMVLDNEGVVTPLVTSHILEGHMAMYFASELVNIDILKPRHNGNGLFNVYGLVVGIIFFHLSFI